MKHWDSKIGNLFDVSALHCCSAEQHLKKLRPRTTILCSLSREGAFDSLKRCSELLPTLANVLKSINLIHAQQSVLRQGATTKHPLHAVCSSLCAAEIHKCMSREQNDFTTNRLDGSLSSRKKALPSFCFAASPAPQFLAGSQLLELVLRATIKIEAKRNALPHPRSALQSPNIRASNRTPI